MLDFWAVVDLLFPADLGDARCENFTWIDQVITAGGVQLAGPIA